MGAGLILAILNIATLLVAGHPWSITYGFGLWGAKAADAVGIPVASWEFWTWPAQAQALSSSVLADNTSVMNFGIILGAGLAAALAGKFAPKAKIPLRSFLAAAIGGILMGYAPGLPGAYRRAVLGHRLGEPARLSGSPPLSSARWAVSGRALLDLMD